MPFETVDDVPAFVKKRTTKEREEWLSIWRETFRQTASETDAFKAANGALALSRGNGWGEPVIECVSDSFPDWEASGKYVVQIMRTGIWRDHPEYGDIVITKEDLADAVVNFRNSTLKPFLDDEHGITAPKYSSNPGKSYGWMTDMWIEDMDGRKVEHSEASKSSEKVLFLKATYEVNEEGNAWLKDKVKALYSPTFYPTYYNRETGQVQGLTVIGGAMTNMPYFDGMGGYTALMESSRASSLARHFAALYPKACFNVSRPEGMGLAEAVNKLDGMGLDVTWADWYTIGICSRDGGDLAGKIEDIESAGFVVSYFSQGPTVYARKGDGQRRPGGSESRGDVRPQVVQNASRAVHATEEGAMALTEQDRIALARKHSLPDASTAEDILVHLSRERDELSTRVASAEERAAGALKVAEGIAKADHERQRELVVGGALKLFKFAAEKREEWDAAFDDDPIRTKALLESVPPGEMSKGEVGRGGDGAEQSRPRGMSATMQRILELRKERIASAKAEGKKLTIMQADQITWDEYPHLYAAYLKENTRGDAKGGND